jgi:histidinol-phosphate aminotransferase
MAFNLNALIPEHIRELKPYASARDEYAGPADNTIFLDANEQPHPLPGLPNGINRYPGSLQKKLLDRIAAVKGLNPAQVLTGNGSDELIDLILSCFTRAGKDQVMVFPPTFGMYAVRAGIHNLEVLQLPLDKHFMISADEALSAAGDHTRIMFICNPNNPSANLQKTETMTRIISQFKGIVVVDEAYMDFCPAFSMLPRLDQHPNLIVLQTMSKAWGLAGARVGIAFASQEIIAVLNKVRLPYNLGSPATQLALNALNNYAEYRMSVSETIKRRDDLSDKLLQMPGVTSVFPSHTNFLLVKTDAAEAIFRHLTQRGIVVRNRSNELHCEGCLRVTVGSREENRALLEAWKTLGKKTQAEKAEGMTKSPAYPVRHAIVQRQTAETRISISVNLDGSGQAAINTGIGFLDHMLHQLARHGLLDLEIVASGDLHIDAHHTLEDTAITLGQAIRKALGNKAGMERYGFELPMDESHAKVLIDFGGRAYLKWDVSLSQPSTGGIPNSLFPHFFRSFSEAAGCNLHITARGEDDHHITEAIFKAFAKAIKMAVARNQSGHIPSTKETL